MSFAVRVEPRGVEFTVRDGETILAAAERQGQRLRYGCRHGRCSSCKYELLDGDVEQPDASIYSLSDAERDDGWALVCCAYPASDLVVHDDAEPDPRARPLLTPTEHVTTVAVVEPIAGNLWRLEVTRPPDLEFYAGQFVELQVPDQPEVWRPYSLASPPEDRDRLAFVVKRIEEGAFSGQLDASWVGNPLGVRGPFGDAYLRAGTGDVVLVATGSGIAPVLSIVGHAANVGDGRRFRAFYGARQRAGLAAVQPLEALAGRVDLAVVTSLSRPADEDRWEGAVGRVTPLVQRQVGDASVIDAYVCGHPDMCASILLLLEAKGIQEWSVFTDEFVPSVGEDG